MSDYQKWVAQVVFTTILVVAWLVMIFMVALGWIDSINAELQGLAIAALTVMIGITSGAGSAIAAKASTLTAKAKGLRLTTAEKK